MTEKLPFWVVVKLLFQVVLFLDCLLNLGQWAFLILRFEVAEIEEDLATKKGHFANNRFLVRNANFLVLTDSSP